MKFKKIFLGGLLVTTMVMSLLTLQVNAEEDGINNIENTYYTSTEIDIYDVTSRLEDMALNNDCEIISNNYTSNGKGTYSVVFKSNTTQATKEVDLVVVEPTYQVIEMGSKNFPFEVKRSDSGFKANIYFNQSDPSDYDTLHQNALNYIKQYNLNDGYIVKKNLKTGQVEKQDFQLSINQMIGYVQDGVAFQGFNSLLPTEMQTSYDKITTNENDFTYKDSNFYYSISFYACKSPTINGQSQKVSITNSNNAIDSNVELVDKEIKLSNKVINQLNAQNYIAYDMSLLLNGQNIQPNGKIEITMDIPNNYDKSKVKVYYEKNGQLVDMNAIIKGNKAIFKTNHFSHYILAETNKVVINTEPVENPKVKDTSTKTKNHANIVQTSDEQFVLIWLGLLIVSFAFIKFNKKSV